MLLDKFISGQYGDVLRGKALQEAHDLRMLIAHTIPLGMAIAIEDAVGHVSGTNDCARHDAGYLFAGTGETENRTGKDCFALDFTQCRKYLQCRNHFDLI